MRSALRAVLLCLCVTLAAVAASSAAETGSIIAVVQGGDGFKIAINNASTVAWAECHGNRLICSAAFAVCTKDDDIGTLGDVTIGLKVALVNDQFRHGKPFTMSLPNGTGTATYLTSSSIDPETGAPLYTAPSGKVVYLVLDQKPAAGFCVGVETFFEINASAEKWCIRRKLYSACPSSTTILTAKEFYLLCSAGIFTTNQHVAQGEVTNNGDIGHAFLSILPGLGQNKITAGSVADGDDFISEFTACSLTGGFSTGQQVGTRYLEMFVDLRPGGSTLKASGKPGSERFLGHCVELQCDTVPPGSGCIPVCVPENPGDPGEYVCPRSHGYFKNHADEWPVSSLTLGSKVYTKPELLALLSAPAAGDASKVLAKQLIAAKLSIASGSDPTPILPTVSAADALLSTFSGKLPYSVAPASATGQQMTALADVLDSYVNGKLTPGCHDHIDD